MVLTSKRAKKSVQSGPAQTSLQTVVDLEQSPQKNVRPRHGETEGCAATGRNEHGRELARVPACQVLTRYLARQRPT